MNAHTTADQVSGATEAYRQMDAFDRELLRKCLDETIAQSRCDKANADDDIERSKATMETHLKAYHEAKNAHAVAVKEWERAHVAEVKASVRLSNLLEGDSR